MPRIKEDVISTIEIKKSRFLTYLHRTNQEEEAKDFLKMIKKEHPGANHHCTAMIIGSIVRSNDDGEPSGTAGHPMLDVLQGKGMEDILAVVVRYFGGTKLGTGGLVKAYSDSVKIALEKAALTEMTMFKEYEITFGYEWIGKLDGYFRNHQIESISKEYEQTVTYHYLTQEDITQDILALSNGALFCTYIKEHPKEKIIES